MPGVRCAVAVCKNSFYKTKKLERPVSYFVFPKDENLRAIWIKSCRRREPLNPKTAFICSVHFRHDDFQRDLKMEMGFSKFRRRLKEGAVPTLHLGTGNSEYGNFRRVRKVFSPAERYLAKLDLDQEENAKHKLKFLTKTKTSEIAQKSDAVGRQRTPQLSVQMQFTPPASPNMEIPLKHEEIKSEVVFTEDFNPATVHEEEVVDTLVPEVNRESEGIPAPDSNQDEIFINVNLGIFNKLLAKASRSCHDSTDFGYFVASELRSMNSPSLRMKLKNKIQRAILMISEEDELEVNPLQ